MGSMNEEDVAIVGLLSILTANSKTFCSALTILIMLRNEASLNQALHLETSIQD